MNYSNQIKSYLTLEREVLEKLDVEIINLVINKVYETYEAEKKIYIFGNGGSSATASHFQNDFNKGISEYVEKKFQFVCLNDNVPTIMAIANDIGFDDVFRFQLINRLRDGDIIMAISGSGNSTNVINAVRYAKEMGNTVIGLTGFDGGLLKQMADLSLHVPINSMQITEDIHMMFDHLIMSVFYLALCGKNHIKEPKI